MIKEKKILFLIHTEYHMMVALSIIPDFYASNEEYSFHIYQTYNAKKKRFHFEKDLELLENLSYDVIEYDERCYTYDTDLVHFINNVLNEGYEEYIFFNHHQFVPIYLAQKLARQKTKITLAPDGLKVYNESKRVTPRWSITDAISFYKFCNANKLNYEFNFPTLTYANLSVIDCVYVPFKKTYKNYTKKEVIEFNLLGSIESKYLVHKFFKFNQNSTMEQFENVIFYINQPVPDKAISDYEIFVLDYLTKNFKDYKIIVKLHPLIDDAQRTIIGSFQDIQIIDESYPAELYIAKLKDSLVLSFWSTACLINNTNVNTYWLYPALIEKGIMLSYVKIKNPTEHIKEVKSLKEIYRNEFDRKK